LKLTVPGVPDTYQGCELWDLSLVDPDNRRPVDFELRRESLERRADPLALLASWRDGRIKQHLIASTLALRRRHPDLFESGSYEPIEVVGGLADRVLAFARRTERAMIIVVVPRLIAALLQDREQPCPAPAAWGDTRLLLPPACAGRELLNHLTERAVPTSSGSLAVAEVLADLPIALLVAT
jgi:(1->4)-alpha-D-glucan 1-alpha-D-glucosylmutase